MIETKPPYEVFVSEEFDTDVCEEIRVFPDYIQYNTRCWPCWIDYSKLEYKLEWGKLLVKAFEYAYVDFDHQYEELVYERKSKRISYKKEGKTWFAVYAKR